MTKAQLGGATVLFIVLMRLAAGYHFFSEGIKKLEPGFSSEGFLRGATGPLADYFHSFAPGPHGAYELLDRPHPWERLEEKQAAEKAESPAAYQAWADRISDDWLAQRDAFIAKAKLDDAAQAEANVAYEDANKKLAEYLKSVREEIEEYQHELWRVEELRQEVHNKGGTLPYMDDRIAAQERDARPTPQPWIAEVAAIEKIYHDKLRSLAPEDADPDQFADVFNPPTTLDTVNTTVTWVVIGAGALLFLGLFTRVAAVVAAGFLASVLATQPPWVYGANTEYFFYQLFEITGLLVLAAVGAGRWLGVDGLLRACCGACCKSDAADNS